MKKVYVALFISLFSFIGLAVFAQVEQGGLPLSIEKPLMIKSTLVFETMPSVDVEKLLAEDSINDKYSDIPWRFGENIEVKLDLSNSGSWDYFEKGDKVWRLGIQCPGAFTINLTFDNYRLPPGAKLFVYNTDQTQIIGAFTDFNNQEDGVFATTLVMGDEIVIEYYEPPYPEFPGELNLWRITHGYRDAYGYAKAFGNSGSCNNNVVCPEAAGWENQIKSVCMLVTGGSGFCSGALVNNTNNNGIPYVLTANHCYSSPSSWVFWFNWQSPTCSNPSSSPPYNSISGATLKARYAASDFCLVQMNSTPPSNYNVYYMGWNRQDAASTSSVGIHHPSGDIKKISFDNNPSSSSDYEPSPYLANSHWKITQWDDGTTEGGSSGSPLFDQNHRVIGQLHGGWASCTSLTADYYGKFSMSWNQGATSATRLRDWLDPTNISGLTLDGYDPNSAIPAPVANFSANNTTPYIGQTVTFTDLSTNTPTSWAWSFSPSTVSYMGGTTSGSQNPQVKFNAGGSYSVTLTATNTGGSDSEVKTNYISVPYIPVANFSANNTTPSIGQTVTFTDQSSNSPTSWAWSFNPATVTYVGGTTSASQNPQVQFTAGGFYSVTLTATNASGGDGETKINYINAQGLPPVATLKLGTVTNPAAGTVLVPVTLEAIDNPVMGNTLISSWSWYIAYDASRLYNASPMTPANLTNYNAQFPSANYVTNIIENHPSPGWNTIAVIYAASVSGTGSVGLKFFDIVFTYTPGTTICPNLFWTSTTISETNMADDEGNEFLLTLMNGCVWSEPPVADFMAGTITPFVGEGVNFTDLSTNYPTSWIWTITPSTVTYLGGTTSTSQNPQVQFNAEGLYTVELTSTNALGSDTETKTDYINVQNPIIDLDITVYLEGPFNGNNMTPGINSILPLNQPYNVTPWNYSGTENVGVIPNANIVDWLLVELRDASDAASATSATMMDRQAAFLLNNGKIVGLDGVSTLQFNNSLTQQLYVVIWHRNHLGVMTANFVTESGGTYTYNFSTGSTQAYGSTDAHKQIGPGVWGMIGGDGNRDGSVSPTDKTPIWETETGTQGYLETDYNLDSQSDNKDKDDIWAPNLGSGSQVLN